MSAPASIIPFVIDIENLGRVAAHAFDAEASELRIPPGLYPHRITIKGFTGNGLDFYLNKFDAHGSAIYLQHNGCTTLTIYND